jgi:hypothetical protein
VSSVFSLSLVRLVGCCLFLIKRTFKVIFFIIWWTLALRCFCVILPYWLIAGFYLIRVFSFKFVF